jgi:hypothetical protein
MHTPWHLYRSEWFTELCSTYLLHTRPRFRTQRITGEEADELPPGSVVLGGSIGMSIGLRSAVNNLFTVDALPRH